MVYGDYSKDDVGVKMERPAEDAPLEGGVEIRNLKYHQFIKVSFLLTYPQDQSWFSSGRDKKWENRNIFQILGNFNPLPAFEFVNIWKIPPGKKVIKL